MLMRNSNIENNTLSYKLVVYGNKLYKETVIPDDVENILIGTAKEAQIRLPKKLYSEDFQITLKKQANTYIMMCGSGNYILNDSGGKEYMHELVPGDRVKVCYEDTDITAIRMDFSLDFGKVQDDYGLNIEIGGTSVISIGGKNCDIKIKSPDITPQKCVLKKDDDGYIVDATGLGFGVEINGITWKGSKVRLKNKQFLTIYGISFYLNDDVLYTVSDGRVETELKAYVIKEQNNQFKYPEFIQNVRLQYIQPKERLNVIPPKAETQQAPWSSLFTMLPMLIMVLMMTVMRSRMYGGGNNSFMIMYGLMYGSMFSITIVLFFVNRRKVKKQNKQRVEVYNKYLVKKDEEIKKEREEERVISQKMNILPDEMINQIQNFDARLFEKQKEHEDYLTVPIGLGKINAYNQVEFREQDELDTSDPLMAYPEELHDKYETIEQMPIVLKLKEVNAIGFVGERQKLLSMTRNIMVTLSGQHFFNDVKFYLLLHPEDVGDFEWARWLQNLSDMGIRNIMYDPDSKKVILDKMYNELSAREGKKEGSLDGKTNGESVHYVVFAYRSKELIEHPITNFIKRAKDLGFTFLFFDEHKELLHKACDEVIYLDSDGNKGFIQEAKDAVKMQGFEYKELTTTQAQEAAIKLACVHVNEISLESTLTKNITFFQMYNILTAYDLKVGERWKKAKIFESMSAPIGVDASGSKVCLDIHEKGHGPHGLVAGTTGAGKSELLQTYVLSMCTQFHPYEVGFIIIDFKGGGMANQFKKLPHLNGAITNIDGKQVNRSLMSIKAELMKRQRLFAEAEVNAIDNYIDLYKKGEVKVPLPHLILIVDEFAELKADQPDFMQELISAARIGRSLGVHLILATQKPSGVVNDQIWSNSRFKLCLKVQDKSDSNEVLKSPLAAEIREPGRCYLEVGNNEIFQLLQSAYSGAPAGVGVVDKTSKFDISAVNLVGARSILYHQEPEKEEANITQLDAIVDYISDYCEENKIEKLSPICLPPLEELIAYEKYDKSSDKETDIIVPLGIYDDPENQVQEVIKLNLTKENTFAIGSSLTGKTNFVQCLIRGLTDGYGADEVSIYILDFASMILRNFAALAHVGGVVTMKDETMLKQFFAMITNTIDERQKLFAEMGLSSFSAYREAGYKELSQIVVFVENYAALKASYEDYEDVFLSICQDGISVGVSVVITNPTATGIGFKLLTAFGRKIAYYCNDSTQYTSLFDRCKLEPDEVPGRAITTMDGQIREFQTYLAFDAKKEIERIDKIRSFVKEVNKRSGDIHAARIPTIPEAVTEEYLEESYGLKISNITDYRIPIGISYSSIEPVYMDMARQTLFSLMGTAESGRIPFIRTITDLLNRNREIAPTKLYVIDDISRELSFVQDLEITAGYSISTDNVVGYINEIGMELGRRYDELAKDPGKLSEMPLIILMINTPLAIDDIMADEQAFQMYTIITSKLRGYRACIMHTNLDNVAITFKSGEILKKLSEEGTHLFFEDANKIKAIDLPNAFIKQNSRKIEDDDAFYIDNGVICKTKTITSKHQ